MGIAAGGNRVFSFARFSDQSRHALLLAQVEARFLNHGQVGPEHILLGVIHEGGGAAAALDGLGVTLEAARQSVDQAVGSSGGGSHEYPTYTSLAKEVLACSASEADELGHECVDPEHILLSLMREGRSAVADLLVTLGTDVTRVRHEVMSRLSGNSRVPEAGKARQGSDAA